jgi:predicted site-specific integrase-resolvase
MVINWLQTDGSDVPAEPPKVRAAEYVRMSTEHQKYSTDNQGEAIRSYAQRRGYEIVRTYADEGKSGLNLGGRLALQQLLEDVETGRADFKALIVYDVSRWVGFKTPTKRPRMSCVADAPAFKFTIALSSSRTMVASARRSSKP